MQAGAAAAMNVTPGRFHVESLLSTYAVSTRWRSQVRAHCLAVAVRIPQSERLRWLVLVPSAERNGNEGLGKPEPLKYGFQGHWSRRITDEHRLIYKLAKDEIRIAQCRYRFED